MTSTLNQKSENQAAQVSAPNYIAAIAPYQAGKPISELAREFGLDEKHIVKLASNENPLGMSPHAKNAVMAALTDAARYPDSNGFALKALIAERFGLAMNQITLGNGSNDILELAARAFLQPGDLAVYSDHSFAVYPLATQAVGAVGVSVPAKSDFGHDLSAMLAAIVAQADKVKMVFVANPNNPTGTFVPEAELLAFLEAVPSHVLVVLDEAYTEYLPPEVRYDSTQWITRFPNLLVSRTFSKAYGLAGLRVGFALAQAGLTDMLNRVRQPFNVNGLAQAAALAAFQDADFLTQSYELNRAGLAQLCGAFESLNLSYVPSFGNFVLVKVGESQDAGAKVYQALLRQGVIVRPVGNYALPQWLRISIGLPEENARFLECLPQALLAI